MATVKKLKDINGNMVATDFNPAPHYHKFDDITDDGKSTGNKLSAALASKANAVSSPTLNHFVSFDSNGNLKDSGKGAVDFEEFSNKKNTISSSTTEYPSCKAVEDALALKASATHTHVLANITDYSIDNTPTQNSNNPVKSGGIFIALNDKENSTNKAKSTDGLNKLSTDTQYPSAKLVFERACGTTSVTISSSTTLDLDMMEEGQAYLLDQHSLSTKRQLQSIIPATPDGERRLCGNDTLAKDYMLIRMFHCGDEYIVVVLASYDI